MHLSDLTSPQSVEAATVEATAGSITSHWAEELLERSIGGRNRQEMDQLLAGTKSLERTGCKPLCITCVIGKLAEHVD